MEHYERPNSLIRADKGWEELKSDWPHKITTKTNTEEKDEQGREAETKTKV